VLDAGDSIENRTNNGRESRLVDSICNRIEAVGPMDELDLSFGRLLIQRFEPARSVLRLRSQYRALSQLRRISRELPQHEQENGPTT